MLPILVIGAGPAGSLAARLLAGAGREVLLIDQHAFPRDKVCGECISALGAAVMQRAGVIDRLRQCGATELTRVALHSPAGSSAQMELPAPMLGLSRWKLDHILLEAAAEAGAEVRLGMRCEAITPRPELAAMLRNLASNRVEPVKASCILLADGKRAFLLRRPGSAATKDLGIKAHFTDVAGPGGWASTIELFGLCGHYAGLAPIEEGGWNLAMSVPAQRVRQCPDLDRLLQHLLAENPILRRRLIRAQRLGPWLAAPLPRYPLRRRWPAGVIPLGNAAAAIEPIGGEGMGLAMRSAELAAEALLSDSPHLATRLQRQFRRLWRPRRAACRAAALCLSRPRLCALAIEVLSGWTWIGEQFMQWMGKAEFVTPQDGRPAHLPRA